MTDKRPLLATFAGRTIKQGGTKAPLRGAVTKDAADLHDVTTVARIRRLLDESRARRAAFQRGGGRARPVLPGESTDASLLPDDSSILECATIAADSVRADQLSERLPKERDLVVFSDRYEDVGALGAGGMGIVRRVHDRLLNRTLAMKILHSELLQDEDALLRFAQEAQVGGQLQHPNILPVYELGLLDDGHLFFTMAEIKGQSFAAAIERVHGAVQDGRWGDEHFDCSLHRLVDIFHDVCKAIAYAHDRGVVHRDLKPENIMIGSFGEVLVVDWGLSKVLGTAGANQPVVTMRSQISSHHTVFGAITGTPAFMAPEQARGRAADADEKSDVYALGAILYTLLRGRPAYEGATPREVLSKVIMGAPPSFAAPCSESNATASQPELGPSSTAELVSCAGAPVPHSLVDACETAMAREPADRFASVTELATVVGRWLDGSKRRETALALVDEARRYDEVIERLLVEASQLRARSKDLQAGIEMWQPEAGKLHVWQLQDRAARLSTDALIKRTEQTQLFRAALAHKGDLEESHSALARRYRRTHSEAETRGDTLAAQRAEVVLRQHVQALPTRSSLRLELLRYLTGTGSLSLQTVPDGASLQVLPCVTENRRLVLGDGETVGTSPLVGRPIAMGSYVAVIGKPGYHETRYPLYNRRLDEINGIHPSGLVAPIELLPEGTLGADDCYVPAGWCWLGGDLQTPNSLPSMRVWIDGFVICRFPVTNSEYLRYLNALATTGQAEKASRHVPREQSSSGDELGAMVYRLTPQGLYVLPDDPDRATCWPSQPVTMIEWGSARAYAAWCAEQTGLPWRLPMEFEWEKAARGVDGRAYPWGDAFDPSWACMKDSHRDDVRMQSVNTFEHDESVYEVRGTAGNTRDWCLDRFRESGPPLANGRLLMPSAEDLADTGFKSSRGGSYGNSASRARSADRDWWFPERSYVGRGIRLAWGLADRSA